MNGLKVNLHLTNRCNYACRYCFGKFSHANDLSLADWKTILQNLQHSGMVSAVNFAGGEPLLYPRLMELFYMAKRCGFAVSLITNGSILPSYPKRIYSYLTMLGISFDSLIPATRYALGCHDKWGRSFGLSELLSVTAVARQVQPDILIKLNTVVTRLNYDERLTQGVEWEQSLFIDRWKFLKMKPFCGNGRSNLALAPSDAEFQLFCQQNPLHHGEAVYEPDLTHSYIIVDNHGDLIDNGKTDGYHVIGSLLQEDFAALMKRYPLNFDRYQNRYTKTKIL